MSLNNLDEVLSGGGGATAFTKDTPIGTTFSGTIVDAMVRQIKDIKDDKPKFWDDGRPQEQIVVRVQTDHRNDADDDGIRALYIKTWGVWKAALLEAVQAGGFGKVSDALAPGNFFSDTYTGDKPAERKGMSPTKLHKYEIRKGSPVALDSAIGGTVNTGTGEITPAPVTAPAPAQPAVPATPDPADLAMQLLVLGLPDNVISAQTGLSDVAVAAMRAHHAA